ncbi:mycofactocin biosynthesis glycosyltransferase MftF [Saccharopolyspora sp. HNM0983]|uniref:Mycofactocin biosynthesis glycosyltransferase MftF n=1 Tax=Saccharopolyspora montiporae TaxID=2781240 RepID=A0A929FY89_9PSEU|nr:mycofactocin biosynthesis glycosyltransferase MftF [Saccharopolyspora sp. HNM0983]MBE9375516.1 mycofactocin biosynthesis glycosyltransferase MftF [Saccharopolyspora sp. HNM0983]
MSTRGAPRSAAAAFPGGTRLVLDGSVRRTAGGRVLLGGSPLRLLRLKTGGAHLLDRWIRGEPVGTGGSRQGLARQLLTAGLVHPEPPAGVFGPADVTLVTPVRNNATGLARLLAATGELTERIVVDDGSDVPVRRAVLRHERPAGPAAARDAGWQRASTDLVAFLDADVTPEPGWLQEVLPQFADPTVAAVAPRVRSVPADTAVARYEAERSSLDLGPCPAIVRPMSRVSYVPSAALVVRRTALREVGGFDQRLRFGEDVDLVWRCIEAGHTVRYAPNSVVWHQPRPTLRSWLRQRFDYGTSAAPLSTRHPGLLSPAKMSPHSAAAWALLAAGRHRSALAVAAVSAAMLARNLRGRGLPVAGSLRLAGLGHAGAGRLLAEATRRAWWPLALAAAAVSRRARRVVLAALLPCLVEAAGRGHRWLVLRVLDDLAYGAGVWAGCARERTAAPLRPEFTGGGLC